MSRMKANASAYVQDRVHEVRLPTGYEGDLIANFAAVLAENNPLQEARWYSDDAAVCGFVSGDVLGRQSIVCVRTTRAGTVEVRCDALAVLGGQMQTQRFVIHVSGKSRADIVAGTDQIITGQPF